MENSLKPVCYEKDDIENSKFIESQDNDTPYFSKSINLIYSSFITLTLISFLFIIFGALLLKKIPQNYLGAIILIVGLFSFFSYLFSFYSFYKYLSIIEKNKIFKTRDSEEFKNLESTFDRKLVDYSVYLHIVFFCIYLIISISSLFFQNQAQLQHNTSFEKTQISALFYVCGFLGIFAFSIQAYFFSLFYKNFINEKITISMVSFSYIILFGFGLLTMYFSIYLWNFQTSLKLSFHISNWISLALFSISSFIILFGLIGFYSAQFKNSDILKLITVIIGGVSLMGLILSFVGMYYHSDYKQFYKNNCNSLLPFVSENYLTQNLNCKSKYIHFDSEISKLDMCPKSRISSVWEKSYTNTGRLYGCLESNCCVIFYETLKSKIEYLVLVSSLLAIVGGFTVFISYHGLKMNYFDNENSNESRIDYAFAVFLIILIAIFLFFSCLIPAKPHSKPLMQTRANLDYSLFNLTIPNNSFVAFQTLDEAMNFQKKQIIEKANFSFESPKNKSDITYSFEITSKKATIFLKNSSYLQNKSISFSTFTNGLTIITKNVTILNDIKNIIDFKYKCPFDKTKVKFNVLAIDGKNSKTLLEKTFAISMTGKTKYVITGRGPSGTTISLDLKGFPGCKSIFFTSDINGNFASTKIPSFIGNPKLELNINATHYGYKDYSEKIVVGGGYDQLVFIGNLPMIPLNNLTIQLNHSNIKVIDSIDLTFVSNLKVYVYRGKINIQNVKIESKSSKAPEIKNYIEKVYSDSQGIINFRSKFNSSEEYTIIMVKKGYFRQTIRLNSLNINTFSGLVYPMTPFIRKGEIRFVLLGNNLDLYNFFEITHENKVCEAFFGQKICQGVSLITSDKYAFQTMTINSLFGSHYTIAVNKFVNNATIFPGEPKTHNYREITRMRNQFIQNPQILIYSHNYLDPIKKEHIPDFSATDKKNIWNVLYCLNGKEGIDNIVTVNKFTDKKPNNYCNRNITNFIQISNKLKRN